MAKVQDCNVEVIDNPTQFMKQFAFEITFECIEDLPDDLEWKMTYVGSAESEDYDQILDTVDVGPVPKGRHKFVFTADPPNPEKIPVSEVVGVTVILLTCSYRAQEFISFGYFVSNEYTDPELQETPPEKPDFDKLERNILASKPRVINHKINWDNASTSTDNPSSEKETDSQSTLTEEKIGVENQIDHHNGNCSNAAEGFVSPMESGDNVDSSKGQTNNHSGIPSADEVENFPPEDTSTDNPSSQKETDPQSTPTEDKNRVESQIDHQNDNSSNTAEGFVPPMESGDNVDRSKGQTNNHNGIPNADEVENFPPGDQQMPKNQLKDQMLEAQSPVKRVFQSSDNINQLVNNHNSN